MNLFKKTANNNRFMDYHIKSMFIILILFSSFKSINLLQKPKILEIL